MKIRPCKKKALRVVIEGSRLSFKNVVKFTSYSYLVLAESISNINFESVLFCLTMFG